jgi:predicted ATP-grasp superfamily ATP-dependent carboligase
MNVLMLAFGFHLPYHVLRCAAEAGASVRVLGHGPARGLAYSRFCRRFHRAPFDPRSDLPDVAEAVATLCRRHGIDLILPADDVSTRMLSAIRGLLPTPTIPVPSLETFDRFNDKSRFARYCGEIGVLAPESTVFGSRCDLLLALRSGALALPLTIKPLNRSGGVGVLHILAEEDIAAIDAIDYAPVLAQAHIDGLTAGISVFARRVK